jgi:hypothetical protein
MLSIIQIFESNQNKATTKQIFKTSGKLIGSGIGLGIAGAGNAISYTGNKLYNKLNPNQPLTPSALSTPNKKSA